MQAWEHPTNPTTDYDKGTTRRVIELQSDLFQKGRLEGEFQDATLSGGPAKVRRSPEGTSYNATEDFKKLEPYRNTWHERVIREEVKQAAKDGKTKLQFPTGETAMKIEGLGETANWMIGTGMSGEKLAPDSLKVGQEVFNGHDDWVSGNNGWIITDVLGDGKFKAVPKRLYETPVGPHKGNDVHGADDYYNTKVAKNADIERAKESFDISGKVDTSNPIYRFYEKEVGRYLKNKYGAQLITDPQGVTWNQVDIKPEYKKLPIEAFGAVGIVGLGAAASNNK